MTSRRSPSRFFAFLFLLGSPACFPAPAATEPAELPAPKIVLDTLPPGTSIRLATNHTRFAGRLLGVTTDSLRLHSSIVDTTVARAQIDTLWLQGRPSYSGTKAGAGAGLLFALLIVLAGHRGAQPEANGYGVLFAGYLVAGGLGLGILADLATPAPWLLVAVQ